MFRRFLGVLQVLGILISAAFIVFGISMGSLGFIGYGILGAIPLLIVLLIRYIVYGELDW